MSVPESVAWLESFAGAAPGQAAQIYATTILGELTRLSEALNTCANELDHREQIRQEERAAHRAREYAFEELEQSATRARDEWDAKRTDLERRLERAKDDLAKAETMLKDVHFALLNQPDLTREAIANTITSVVNPYPEGAKA